MILAAIARSGGASLAVTGGAVLSGAYLGGAAVPGLLLCGPDRRPGRGGAARLSAADVADHASAPGPSPWYFTGGISLLHPIQQVDQTILRALEEGFDLSWTVVLPAVILLVLPAGLMLLDGLICRTTYHWLNAPNAAKE